MLICIHSYFADERVAEYCYSISPLRSLMKDMCLKLHDRSISAACIVRADEVDEETTKGISFENCCDILYYTRNWMGNHVRLK